MTSQAARIRLTIFFVVLLDVMGLGLIIPVQPFLAQLYGASLRQVTLLGTTYSLMQFIFAPLWGTLSDRVGRRVVLLGTLGLTVVGHLLFAFAGSLPLLFLARAVSGIGAANISTAQAVIADTHDFSERSRAMALIGAAFGFGFILGPLCGGLLAQYDFSYPALFAAALAGGNIIFVGTYLSETRVVGGVAAERTFAEKLRFLFADTTMLRLASTTLLTMIAFALMEQTIGLYIKEVWVLGSSLENMKDASSMTKDFLVVVGITGIFVQGYLVRKWMRKATEVTLIRAGLITLCVSLLLIPSIGAFENFRLFLLTGVPLAFGSGLFNPSMLGLVSKSCGTEQQGLGLAINQSASSMARIIAPTIAGALMTWYRPSPFLLGAGLIGISLLISAQLRVPQRPE
jgi:DHA1 family tetracycline resistance protein-like MFS transporter